MPSYRLYPFITILSLLFILGIDSMWGLIFRNGYFKALTHIRDYGPYVLPLQLH